MDWGQLLRFDTPPLEILFRGTVMYLALFTMLRLVLKRESGTTGVTDLLVLVLIADAAQNAMAGSYTSISDGLLLVGVIIAWSFALDQAAFRWRWAERLIRPHPLPLVRHGRIIRRNMRRELVTESELYGQLRQQGIDDLSRVREMRIEADGQFSVTTSDGQPRQNPQRRRKTY